jgi:four helix bundle protein
MGSACELEYFLLLARDLKFLADDHYQANHEAVIEIKRMLAALIDTLSPQDDDHRRHVRRSSLAES